MIRRIKEGRSAEATAEQQAQVRQTVEAILGEIGRRGEAAVREYSEKFDKWSPASFRLSAAEIESAVASLPAQTIRDIVVFCRDAHCVNAIDLMERCAEEGHPAYLDGEPVDRADLAAVLAETRDD